MNWLTDKWSYMIASGQVEGYRILVEVRSSNPQIESLNTDFKGGVEPAGNSIATRAADCVASACSLAYRASHTQMARLRV